MTLWRISNYLDLQGVGGERANGRWHTAGRGKRIVYLAEHPAVALIESLANLKGNPRLFPDFYQLLHVVATDGPPPQILRIETLPPDWREALPITQTAGDAWLASGSSALFSVPSAPSPESKNYLLNPLHPDAKYLAVVWNRRIAYDKRSFRMDPVA